MNIYVCVKHVPDSEALISLTGQTSFEENRVGFVVNPYDENALEAAIQLRESKSADEVIAVCVGKKNAADTLRRSMAIGADRSILVKVENEMDPSGYAKALAHAIKADGNPGLVFCGKQSIDSEGMQTMFLLGKELDFPVMNNVVDFKFENDKIIVESELEAGSRLKTQITLPAVIGAGKGLNSPRYPKIMDIMKAKKKEVQAFELPEALLSEPLHVKLLSMEPSPERSNATILSGSLQESVAHIVTVMREKAKIF